MPIFVFHVFDAGSVGLADVAGRIDLDFEVQAVVLEQDGSRRRSVALEGRRSRLRRGLHCLRCGAAACDEGVPHVHAMAHDASTGGMLALGLNASGLTPRTTCASSTRKERGLGWGDWTARGVNLLFARGVNLLFARGVNLLLG